MIDLGFIHASPFYELTALLSLAIAVGLFGLLLRQPMVVSFIAVGVIASPSALGIIQSYHHIELLAELAIAVLLFLVGLKLDLKLIRTLGVVSLATGLGQVAFTSIIGFGIGLALGLDYLTSIYIGVALTFSSTIIIVKLLSDKREVDSLHGRIALGFLIVQDLVVVFAMMILSAFGLGHSETSDGTIIGQVFVVLGYGLLMLLMTGGFIRYIANPLMHRVSRSSELLIIFAMGWSALLAALGSHFGFSKELGGLLAGVALASTPYREAIIAKLSSLRDFLLLFFFIALGSKLDLSLLGDQLFPAFVFSIFVLIGNPLIVMIIMGFMGYRKRTGFLAGLTVAQISEFSLIFMAMGLSLGHVNGDALGLVTLVGLITIALSVYMITYSHSLFRFLEPFLGVFERKSPAREDLADQSYIPEKENYDVVLFGLGRYGAAIAERLRADRMKILAVDFNPDEIRRWRRLGYDATYGDACDHDFLASLPLRGVQWIISAMPQHDLGLTHGDPRLVMIDGLKSQGYQGKIAISTRTHHDAETLKAVGAHLVFLPFSDAAERAVERIKECV